MITCYRENNLFKSLLHTRLLLVLDPVRLQTVRCAGPSHGPRPRKPRALYHGKWMACVHCWCCFAFYFKNISPILNLLGLLSVQVFGNAQRWWRLEHTPFLRMCTAGAAWWRLREREGGPMETEREGISAFLWNRPPGIKFCVVNRKELDAK